MKELDCPLCAYEIYPQTRCWTYFDRGIPTCLQTHVLSPHFLSVFHFILINVLEAVVYLSRQGAPEVQTEMPSLTWFKAVALTCCLVSTLITNKRNFKKLIHLCHHLSNANERKRREVYHLGCTSQIMQTEFEFCFSPSGQTTRLNPRCFSSPGGSSL